MVNGIVTKNTLNIRASAPNRKNPVIGRLKKGETINIVSACYGEEIDGVSIWYKLDSGCFAWSGYVYVKDRIHAVRRKIIFTADDYGVVDSVNNGVIAAIKKGRLNSVTCLTNYGKKGKDSLLNIRKLQNQIGSKNNVELGVHLTITSGSPVLGRENVPLLCRPETEKPQYYEQSDFYDFTDVLKGYKAMDGSQKNQFRTQLKSELKAQLDVFIKPEDNLGVIPLNHITSHHNSLLYHPDFFVIMKDLAAEYNVKIEGKSLPTPLRSLTNIPTWKDYLFMTLKGKVDCSPSLMETFRDLIDSMDAPTIQTPDLLHSDHYGPPPFIASSGWPYRRLISKKEKICRDMIDDLFKRDLRHMEFLLHLREGEVYTSQADFERNETRPTGYAGIDPLAFDSRTAELASFINVFSCEKDLPEGLEMTSWKEIRMA